MHSPCGSTPERAHALRHGIRVQGSRDAPSAVQAKWASAWFNMASSAAPNPASSAATIGLQQQVELPVCIVDGWVTDQAHLDPIEDRGFALHGGACSAQAGRKLFEIDDADLMSTSRRCCATASTMAVAAKIDVDLPFIQMRWLDVMVTDITFFRMFAVGIPHAIA